MESRLGEATLYNLEGTEIIIENVDFHLLSLFAERVAPELAERHGVFIAQRRSDGMECVVKMRLQMNPKSNMESKNSNATAEWANDIFRGEVDALRITAAVEATPRLLAYGTLIQSRAHQFPGGYLNVIAMSKMPGKPITDYEDFNEEDTQTIIGKVRQGLEDMRLAGWNMDDGDPDKVIWDPVTTTVSITGISSGIAQDSSMSNPIRADGGLVRQYVYDLWDEELEV